MLLIFFILYLTQSKPIVMFVNTLYRAVIRRTALSNQSTINQIF